MLLNVDVVILGGGPAGISAAISLLQKKYTVALIEKTGYASFRIGETISPAVSGLFGKLGIDDKILKAHLPSYLNKSIWGSNVPGEDNFFYNPLGHGWHLDRMKFDKQLIDQAVKMGVHLFSDSNIQTIDQNKSGKWLIRFLKEGHEKAVNAGFAIDATGRSALLVKHQGGGRKNIDHLIGIVSVIDKYPKQKHSNYTLVEAVKNGWWYSADLPGEKLVVAFMTDADIYKLGKRSAENFCMQNLSAAKLTLKRCGRDFNCNPVVYAANSYIMTKRAGKNWLAIGDAATTYDPLSSSGIFKAMRDGIEAANSIAQFFIGYKNEIRQFSDLSKERFIKYLQLRTKYYEMEKRWEDSLFWNRRKSNLVKS